jgi:hypothetical protein
MHITSSQSKNGEGNRRGIAQTKRTDVKLNECGILIQEKFY